MLLFMFVFVFSLLGMQIYQGNYGLGADVSLEDIPRGNYETFSIAFVTVFQVLTMENWQTVLF